MNTDELRQSARLALESLDKQGNTGAGDLFAGGSVPIEAQIECVRRELGFRLSVYARRVQGGTMSSTKMDVEITRMRAVENSLWRLCELLHEFPGEPDVESLRRKLGGPI